MDRYDHLVAKRDAEGLSDNEANELGRLMAERNGETYGNADDPPPDVESERTSKEPEEALRDEVQTERDVDDSILVGEGAKGRETDNPPVA
jgi:hypothetical protein